MFQSSSIYSKDNINVRSNFLKFILKSFDNIYFIYLNNNFVSFTGFITWEIKQQMMFYTKAFYSSNSLGKMALHCTAAF